MQISLLVPSLVSLFCASAALAAPPHGREAPPPPDADGCCQFDSSKTPECWGRFNLSTNYYDDGPSTGVVREYWFDVVNSTMAPDGVERTVLSINGTVPGPTIIADWGDTIVVHVRNLLQDNGTSIHFHGIRQNYTTEMDGVASVTQCPTPPGDSMTYTFKATQYGSSWYHSHFQLQAWNGVFGGIIINGPASAPYDEDLGTLILNDWFHETADQLYARASTRGPPTAANGLLNGTNVFGDGGRRFEAEFAPGRRYRVRVVNAAMDTMFRFALDGHNLTVIAADLVPIVPYETASVNVGIGQRYDLVIAAAAADVPADDAAAAAYWLRAVPSASCGSRHADLMNIKGVVRYRGAASASASASAEGSPTTSMLPYEDSCADEPAASLVPVVPLDVGEASRQDPFVVGLQVVDGWFKWTLNKNTFLSDWGYPSLLQAISGNQTWQPNQQVVTLEGANQWVYFVIENTGFDHPIHLHGHDVHILSRARGRHSPNTTLQLKNPPRRDVVMLPAHGHLVLAFKTDNPGVWLMHCHIGWHTGQGFALQLVERAAEIPYSKSVLSDSCATWSSYATDFNILQDDSGI
ncbi:hypothetical protein RB601_009546 [Gaeumannomyces tritici]